MIRIKKSSDNQFYYVLVAANGENLMTSEMHTRKEKAMSGAWAALDIMRNDENVEVIDDTVPRKRSYVRKMNSVSNESVMDFDDDAMQKGPMAD